jgi:hypothetical protein
VVDYRREELGVALEREDVNSSCGGGCGGVRRGQRGRVRVIPDHTLYGTFGCRSDTDETGRNGGYVVSVLFGGALWGIEREKVGPWVGRKMFDGEVSIGTDGRWE